MPDYNFWTTTANTLTLGVTDGVTDLTAAYQQNINTSGTATLTVNFTNNNFTVTDNIYLPYQQVVLNNNPTLYWPDIGQDAGNYWTTPYVQAAGWVFEPYVADPKIEKKKLTAKRKAEKLLLSELNDDQIIDFKARRAFKLRSASGKLFELREGRSRNIKLLNEDGTVKRTYCIHPAEYVPDCDTLLAQKFYLECNEEEFMKVAYVS